MSDHEHRRQVGDEHGNVILDLFVLDQRIGELLGIALAETGVRPAEYAVYSQLGRGPLTPSQLCDRLGVSRSTMTGHLAALHRRGDTEHVPDPTDRRSHQVALTERGRARLEECRPRFRTALSLLEANLETDLQESRRLLALIDRAGARTLQELEAQRRGRRH